MNDSHYARVLKFNKKFGLPTPDDGPPRMLTADEYLFRLNFLCEELLEYQEAVEEGDLATALDALVDLVYVALSTAAYHRFPFDEAFGLVHSANMQKRRAATKEETKRGHRFDLIKPGGWKPPDLESLLKEIRLAWERHS